MWRVLGLICLAGLIGGTVNAFLSEKGFSLPSHEVVNGHVVIIPGFMGNMLLGVIAACVSFGLYGPLASQSLISRKTNGKPAQDPELALSAFAGAILVGLGGARWISTESEKLVAQQMAIKAGETAKDYEVAAKAQAAVAQNVPEPPSSWVASVNNARPFEGYAKLEDISKSFLNPPVAAAREAPPDRDGSVAGAYGPDDAKADGKAAGKAQDKKAAKKGP